MSGFQPAAPAGHGAVQRAHQHDADDRFPRARRKFFAAGDKVSGSVVDQDVERFRVPNVVDHGLDLFGLADVTAQRVNWSFRRKLILSLFEDFFAASADIDLRAEFEETLCHAFAKAGASAGDEYALGLQ